MLELTKLLYQKLLQYAERIPVSEFPYKLKDLISDIAFTPYTHFDCDEEFIIGMDGGHAYINVMKEIEDIVDVIRTVEAICMSDDIGEGPEYGDYLYYAGYVLPELPFLFMIPPFPWVSIPSRLILYDRRWQFEMSTDDVSITIFPVNQKTRSVLLDVENRKKGMTEILRYSERPRLDTT